MTLDAVRLYIEYRVYWGVVPGGQYLTIEKSCIIAEMQYMKVARRIAREDRK